MQTSIVLLVLVIINWPIWTTRNPLPQSLSGSGCAVINDTIYIIGGRDSPGNRYATTYAYDLNSDIWSTKTSMSTPRAHLGCAAVNGKIYAIGGWVGSTATGVVEEYDPVTDTWTTKTLIPTPRYTLGIAVVANKIYVIGGMNMQGQIFNTIEEYDPLTDTWTAKTPMPTQRMGPGCAVVNDTIYAFGGSTVIGGGVTTVNECYDPITDNWTTRTSMITGRYALGGFAWYNRAFAVGGYDYSTYHTSVEMYYPTDNTWLNISPMQYARQSVAVGLVGQYAYVIGGWNNGAWDYNEEGWFEIGIEEYKQAQSMVAFDVRPNPFTTSIRINLTLPDKKACELQIFDVSGRLVRKLTQSSANGNFAFEWDGKSNNGTNLPNGTYILVIKGTNQTKKLILIR